MIFVHSIEVLGELLHNIFCMSPLCNTSVISYHQLNNRSTTIWASGKRDIQNMQRGVTWLLKRQQTRDRWSQRTMWKLKSVVFARRDPGACWGGSRRVCGRAWWGDRFAWSIYRRAGTWSASPRCACENVASVHPTVRISLRSLAMYTERASRLRKHTTDKEI